MEEERRRGPARRLPRDAAIGVRQAKRRLTGLLLEAERARLLARGGADGSSLVRSDDGDPTKVLAAISSPSSGGEWIG